jgi:tRNA-dihydrouridine synthase A
MADTEKTSLDRARRFVVAPMMDWTDRHCRFLHRQLTRHALLFTEMVNSGAIVHGEAERHLAFAEVEHPVALQIGGSDPDEVARATEIATTYGYDEINLNVGCPSDRVQSGKFGACLMAEPALVAELVRAMRAATHLPVTVKCRLGIDDQDTGETLDRFVDTVVEAGIDALYVHARKAWLKGLSPKENRTVPPLDHGRVHCLRERIRPLPVILNGGIETMNDALAHLGPVDGVMLGRAAYHEPTLLAEVDARVFGDMRPVPSLEELLAIMADYAAAQMAQGVRVNHIARHMLGLANGRPGARMFRQILSTEACRRDAGPEIFARAWETLEIAGARQAAE